MANHLSQADLEAVAEAMRRAADLDEQDARRPVTRFDAREWAERLDEIAASRQPVSGGPEACASCGGTLDGFPSEICRACMEPGPLRESIARALYVHDDRSAVEWDREQRPDSWKDRYRTTADRVLAALSRVPADGEERRLALLDEADRAEAAGDLGHAVDRRLASRETDG